MTSADFKAAAKPLYAAVIPVAGMGTRTWPASIPGVVSKNMLPADGVPLIVRAVEEAFEAGLEKIVLVCGPDDEAQYRRLFSERTDLLEPLRAKGKKAEAEQLEKLAAYGRKIDFVVQAQPLGLGHAVYQAKDLIRNLPFAVILPDDYFFTGDKPGCTAQLAQAYREQGGNIMSAMEVAEEDVKRYGIVQGTRAADGSVYVSGVKEKPASSAETGGSRMAIMGRDICQPELMDYLATQPPTAGGEIQLRDAQERLRLETGQQFYGYHLSPDRAFRLDYGTAAGRQDAEGKLALIAKGQELIDAATRMSALSPNSPLARWAQQKTGRMPGQP